MNWTFDGIRQYLVGKLSLLSNWTTKLFSKGVYARVLDLIAITTQNLAYTAEFLYKESFLGKAELLSSLFELVYWLNYRPHRKIGANGVIKISADSTFAIPSMVYTDESVFIAKWSKFGSQGNVSQVYTIEDKTYFKNTVIKNTVINAGGVATNEGAGTVGIPVTAHGFPSGALVSIRGSLNYDGDYTVLPTSTTNKIIISVNYTAETFTGSEKIYTGHLYIRVREGVPKEFLYTAQGLINEVITVVSNSIENDILDIDIVNNAGTVLASVTKTTEPYLINNLTNYYAEVLNASDFSKILIRFGDGIHTRKLTTGELVRIRYADTKGVDGDITSTHSITQINSTLLTAAGNVAALFVTNDDQISDGDTYETKDSIRAKSRALFDAGYRATSRTDWETIVNSYPAVAKSKVWTDYDLDDLTISPNANLVFITAISKDGGPLTINQETVISLDYLKDYRSLTDIVRFLPLQVVNVRLSIVATVRNVPFTQVKSEVLAAMQAKYSSLNTDFKTNVYESNIVKTIDDTPNIIFHKTTVYHAEKSEVIDAIKPSVGSHVIIVSRTAIDEPDVLKQVLIIPLTVEVWLRRKVANVILPEKRIVKTNTIITSQLDGDNNYTVAGGLVIYASNTVAWNITDILNDKVPFGDADGATKGTQKWGFTAQKNLTSPTGLANNLTVYTFTVTVNGGLPQTIPVVGQNAQTMQTLIAEINASLTGAIADFDPTGTGFIRITSNTWGVGSTILMADISLFAAITNANPTPVAAVAGVDGQSFGVFNPSSTDPKGYWLRLVYKTKDGNGNFTQDIRLPNFYNITNVQEDDLFYDLQYLNNP